VAVDPLRAAYRRRLSVLRTAVEARLRTLYGGVIDFDDLAGSFDRYVELAAPVIEAGQISAAALAEACLESRAARAGVALAIEEIETAVGTTRAGAPLAEGMAAFGPMVLEQVGLGRSREEVLGYGEFLATRFADAELTGTVDRIEQSPEVRQRVTGWEGTVRPDACDGCQANAGAHPVDWEPYRHGNCDCIVEPLFG